MTTKPKPNRRHYTLTLTPESGDRRPPDNRLRRLLKYALRTCGLRCLTVTRWQDGGERR